MLIKQLAHLLIKKIFANYKILKQIIVIKNKLFILNFHKKLRKFLNTKKEISILFYFKINN